MRSVGVTLEPLWMSIEDNTAGYDIKSYDPGPEGPTARLIEVKSTIMSPLRFQLSRNEWNTAQKYGAAYYFHVWDMQSRRLHVRTVADIRPHIPSDNVDGEWRNVEIRI